MCCYNAGQATLKRMIAVQPSHCVSHYLLCFYFTSILLQTSYEKFKGCIQDLQINWYMGFDRTTIIVVVFIVLLLNLQNDLIYIKSVMP